MHFSAASSLQGTLKQKCCWVIDKLSTKPASLAELTAIKLIEEKVGIYSGATRDLILVINR